MDDNILTNSTDLLPTSYGKNSLKTKRNKNQEKHAELFRKDLISAMKMADSETLQPEDYFEIIDSWKLEWERGVQVPVDPNAFLPIVHPIDDYYKKIEYCNDFFLPKKLFHSVVFLDNSFKPSVHEPYDLQNQVDSMCKYDLDELDLHWLEIFNQSRLDMGQGDPISECEMERLVEEIEQQCYVKMSDMERTIEQLGIEYDENVVCDICRSPEGDENNEMVFCDNCNICVHQACYGIQNIPEGSWLCRTCALGIKPKCVLCPMSGGAMKCTKGGDKWAHISCALWVPEVSIGCPEKMEPITNISQIPVSRWALVCVLCRDRTGACIQCSIKSCKTSFHVTCAFKYSLNLSTVIDEETEDVQMKAFCPKHSGISEKIFETEDGTAVVGAAGDGSDLIVCGYGSNCGGGGGSHSGGSHGGVVKGKRNKEILTEEMRKKKLKQLSEEFYTFPDLPEISNNLDIDYDVVVAVHSYWTLKRKSQFDKPLMTLPAESNDDDDDDEDGNKELDPKQEKMLAQQKMFIQFRQELERVRNLCYMIIKREKMKRHMQKMKEETFNRQAPLIVKLLE
ncbi:hypothetical protein HELRODRAFT_111636, partial [Helobdella robusta]|uniref:PHD-type domain-containing protein n=1 Tax=Helobdella robusta TaxID=6412 RepID=T1EFD0_HELRO